MKRSISLLCRVAVVLILAWPLGARAAQDSVGAVRIGLTAVFLDDQASLLQEWRGYLETRLGRDVKFVQRQTYREITEMLIDGTLDFAWVCGYPFVKYRAAMRLMAVPLFEGQPLYRSYLIVRESDESTRDITDLQGRIFAFSDPDSNSGYLVPQVELIRQGIVPRTFFARTFFTWAHRDVVRAVAEGLADGGAVDGYVWETLKRDRPDLVANTRVVRRSRLFGFPPFVARKDIDEALFRKVQQEFLGMAENLTGRRILDRLNLDGFTEGDAALFEDIRQAMQDMERGGAG